MHSEPRGIRKARRIGECVIECVICADHGSFRSWPRSVHVRTYRVARRSGRIATFRGKSAMALIRIWADDNILASGIYGPIDVFTAANYFAAQNTPRRTHRAQPIQWRVESIHGKPVRAVSGQLIAVEGRIEVRQRADAILVAAPFIGEVDRFVAQRKRLNEFSAALRGYYKRRTLIASYCTGAYLLAEAGLL